MSGYTDQATRIFMSGCNCAQSAFVPFCRERGLDEAVAMRIAATFGGGIGGMKETCGALTGSFMALGLAEGYGEGCTKEDKAAMNARVQALAEEFRERFGSLSCRELLARNEADGSAQSEERPCLKYVLAAVEHLERALNV